jgi:hypothetical protein
LAENFCYRYDDLNVSRSSDSESQDNKTVRKEAFAPQNSGNKSYGPLWEKCYLMLFNRANVFKGYDYSKRHSFLKHSIKSRFAVLTQSLKLEKSKTSPKTDVQNGSAQKKILHADKFFITVYRMTVESIHGKKFSHEWLELSVRMLIHHLIIRNSENQENFHKLGLFKANIFGQDFEVPDEFACSDPSLRESVFIEENSILDQDKADRDYDGGVGLENYGSELGVYSEGGELRDKIPCECLGPAPRWGTVLEEVLFESGTTEEDNGVCKKTKGWDFEDNFAMTLEMDDIKLKESKQVRESTSGWQKPNLSKMKPAGLGSAVKKLGLPVEDRRRDTVFSVSFKGENFLDAMAHAANPDEVLHPKSERELAKSVK